MNLNEENLFSGPLNVLYSVLNSKVDDVNTQRSSSTNPRAKQWIFPTLPESEDQQFPKLALISGDANPEPYGAGEMIAEEEDRDVLGTIMVLPITVGVFIRRS